MGEKLLGLIAGRGEFPKLLARAASDRGHIVEAFGIVKVTDPDLEEYVSVVHWMELGQFGRFIDICRERGIERVAMAGQVPHTAIFRYRGFDKRSLQILKRAANFKADSILGAVTMELAKEHIEVIESTMFLRSLMPKKGLLTPKRKLTNDEQKDVKFGLGLAKEIARLDIGQSVAVKNQAVVAVESIKGTDEMIRYAGQLVGPGFVVCKVAKPDQDARFDVPVVGVTTIETLAKAGGIVLAFEAGATLFFGQEEAVERAHAENIGIISAGVAE
jgi:DUF1009 family protein